MIDKFVLFLATNSWIVTLILCGIEVWVFCVNWRKLKKIQTVFPDNAQYISVEDGNSRVIVYHQKDANSSLTKLIEELNDYLMKNNGTADFSILQNKTERYIKIAYEDAIARLAFPTYIGLGGTFLGVWIGLYCFNLENPLLNDDARIAMLIQGVIIAMLTSLLGLIFSTWSNNQAATTKKKLDENKSTFYEFIQNELMPSLGTSMVSSLSLLRSTINRFEPAFNRVIDRFQSTFASCTNAFGQDFRQNVTVVSEAVREMGKNIAVINENVKNQRELLAIMHSNETNLALRGFVEAAEHFNKVTNTIEQLEELKAGIVRSSNSLVNAQNKYNVSLAIPRQVGENLNRILDRITTFEENIKEFGEAVSKTQLLGNKEMNLIEEQLNVITSKQKLAELYSETNEEELRRFYETQRKKMEEVNQKHIRILSDSAEDLDKFMSEISRGMKQKQESLLRILEDSFNTSELQTNFAYLNKLPLIEKRLQEVETALKKDSDIVNALTEVKDIIGKKTVGTASSGYEMNGWAKSARPYIPNTTRSLSSGNNQTIDDEAAEELPVKNKSFFKKMLYWKN